MTDYRALLEALAAGRAEFVIVGGFAAAVHGSSRFTADLDVVYRRTPDNLDRLAAALAPHQPYPRGAPPGLPFQWDVRFLQAGLNFPLETSLGEIDLLGEVAGGGTYESLRADSQVIQLSGFDFSVVTLRRLIALKRAAGRPRDYESVAELEALEEEAR